MLMPKKNRMLIYENLFKEGVLVAKKDPYLAQHPDLEGVPNLQVMKACQSLKSKGYVKENFTWGYYYWVLTNEGIQFLRDFLHLPPEIVPSTLKRQTRPVENRPQRGKVDGPRPAYQQSDRDSYRHAGMGGPDKKAEVGAGTGTYEFRGGYGRGRGAPPPQ